MQKFAKLLDNLYFTYSHLGKLALLQDYFATTDDPDRGFALGIIAGDIKLPFLKRSLIQELIKTKIDPYLFELSYDYVGDMSETVALLWPQLEVDPNDHLPQLAQILDLLNCKDKQVLKQIVENLFNHSTAIERWALLKLGTSSLRIGVSTRFLKTALANFGNKDVQEIEEIWHALAPPYENLFAWLEGKSIKPETHDSIFFHPVMLSHPLSDKELLKINSEDFLAEKKIDGIRIQLVCTAIGKALYSRTGDDISAAFPDVIAPVDSMVVLDGELVIQKDDTLGSFNDLQQRLNRKKPSKKLMQDSPGFIILYDILSLDSKDLRSLPFVERRKYLAAWFDAAKPKNMLLSEIFKFTSSEELQTLRQQVLVDKHIAVEGLMLKRKDSPYIAGRPTGYWYKWKRDPFLVDAILMYAQRGHGKRSSFYSDFTFGLWQADKILPIGKAYFGFTDEELKQLDHWVRHHITQKFGPVCEVEKLLVLEIAFDAVNRSARHKSGFALRFPRVNRIRWDKPAGEADHLEALEQLLVL
jgi:DNA ligase-1